MYYEVSDEVAKGEDTPQITVGDIDTIAPVITLSADTETVVLQTTLTATVDDGSTRSSTASANSGCGRNTRNYNFIGDRIRGYERPTPMLTVEAAEALKAVSDELIPQGYRLKIYDTYRPQRAVDHFVEWSHKADDTRMKRYFYPDLDKTVLFPQGYIAAKSGHSRGSTVDLTLFDMRTEKEVDMGGTFDWFGPESHPDWGGNPETQQFTGKFPADTPAERKINEFQFRNRMLLRSVMLKHGFKPVDTEWWHFTLENEPYPDTYFDYPVR